ncbi:8-oxo-dGTP diphosphatase MutT [Sandarakinorhabdus sp. DWP1-3-1]|uniref:8-oxo-dGTP diphosphatase MutT n=1 Tax=Sandarakinorhabdus sp. DWP1-3-1 TaxID=2804627 RepID=UPI003CE6AAAC
MPRIVYVAAAALVDSAGYVLVAQRPEGKSLAGLWEFPGGKLEPGETPEVALVRELGEELGINVVPAQLRPLCFASHAYREFHLVMMVYLCRAWLGEPLGFIDQPVQWCSLEELAALPMPPADRPVLAALAKALTPGD